ncbi:MAG TPA: cytochrome c oxidase subunit II [Chloroflexota bacterium]|jgi:cytochrome c oxidase subunit 2|nr:cytochrome c oxidase subunit II [Chloroflexota bacterium]
MIVSQRRLLPIVHKLAPLAIIPLVLVLTSCSGSAQTTLAPESDFADKIQFLLKLTFFSAVGVFVIVEGVLVWVLFRYRAPRVDPGIPNQIHGNTRLEVIWTIIPAVLLIIVAYFTTPIIFETQAAPPADALKVHVIGHQWWWEFQYDDFKMPDGSLVTTANELHLPVGKTATFDLDSADVMHSFWLPRLGGKRDVIPNHTNNLWWTADTVGTTPGQCAQYCGTSHANMRMDVVVQSQADFDAWMKDQQTPPSQQVAAGSVADGKALFARSACIGCHTIDGVSQGTVGPNLTHVGSRGIIASGILQNTPSDMAKWIKDPPAEKPGSLMPNLHLSDQDVNNLVAYLESLK